MAIALRLSRGGSKKRPYYRVVATDNRSPRDGKYLEQIGTYNPLLAKDDESRVRLIEDRVRYWLGVGAQPTDRVARMLDKAGIRERAATSNPQKGEPGQKAKDRVEDRAKKLADAEDARREAEQAARAPAEEAPAEEAPAEEAPAEAVQAEEAPAEEAPAEATPAETAVDAPAELVVNEATPNGDAGDTAGEVTGESSQEPAEG